MLKGKDTHTHIHTHAGLSVSMLACLTLFPEVPMLKGNDTQNCMQTRVWRPMRAACEYAPCVHHHASFLAPSRPHSVQEVLSALHLIVLQPAHTQGHKKPTQNR